jgi:hypothetical protein
MYKWGRSREGSERGMTYMVMRREKTKRHAAAASTTGAATAPAAAAPAAPSAGTCTLCKCPEHTSGLLKVGKRFFLDFLRF